MFRDALHQDHTRYTHILKSIQTKSKNALMIHKTSFSCFHVIKSKTPAVKLCTMLIIITAQMLLYFSRANISSSDGAWLLQVKHLSELYLH